MNKTETLPGPPPTVVHHRYGVANGVRLHYVEAGAGPLVVLLHGFPDFWYSWRHQIPALAARGRPPRRGLCAARPEAAADAGAAGGVYLGRRPPVQGGPFPAGGPDGRPELLPRRLSEGRARERPGPHSGPRPDPADLGR